MGMGDGLVHCAHGRGRSTTVMCACLVKFGLYPNWEAALEAIKKRRRVAKLNRAMRAALTAWQAKYVDGRPVKSEGQDLPDAERSMRGSEGSLARRMQSYGQEKLK